ncbi:hypothetical protein G9X27_08460 [Salmonella enterica subsp. enterica serovar Adjame]|nr:hypothetical protein G9X27_08460 [Salmonella enterica subsp. enterica serovar Adjame]
MEVYFKGIVLDGFGIARGIVSHNIYGVVNAGDEPHFFAVSTSEDKSSEKRLL